MKSQTAAEKFKWTVFDIFAERIECVCVRVCLSEREKIFKWIDDVICVTILYFSKLTIENVFKTVDSWYEVTQRKWNIKHLIRILLHENLEQSVWKRKEQQTTKYLEKKKT